MARTQKKRKKVKTINTLGFSKFVPVDRALMSAVNTYCSLPQNEGIPPTSVIRNYLLRNLLKEIKQSTKQAS